MKKKLIFLGLWIGIVGSATCKKEKVVAEYTYKGKKVQVKEKEIKDYTYYLLIPLERLEEPAVKRAIIKDYVVDTLLSKEAREKKLHEDPIYKLLWEIEYKNVLKDYVIYRWRKEREKKVATLYHARHILQKKKEDIEKAREKILKKEISFEEYAKKYSEDPGSKEEGGDLGYFPPGSMVPPFEEALAKLKEGEISSPVETQYGWHLIQLIEKKEVAYEEFLELIEKSYTKRGTPQKIASRYARMFWDRMLRKEFQEFQEEILKKYSEEVPREEIEKYQKVLTFFGISTKEFPGENLEKNLSTLFAFFKYAKEKNYDKEEFFKKLWEYREKRLLATYYIQKEWGEGKTLSKEEIEKKIDDFLKKLSLRIIPEKK